MRKNNIFVALVCAGLLCSCTSIKQPDEVFSRPDYTEEDVRREEIKRIDALREKDTVQALWRAALLGDEGTIEKCSDAVVVEYKDCLEKQNWYDALRLYDALEKTGYAKLSSLAKNSKELTRLTEENVPGLKNPLITEEKRATYVSGTATIWVDRGIKVERGMGFADRVIGSGFFISKDGYLVTNHHVIEDLVNPKYEGYVRLYIKLSGDTDTRIPAKVIGWDPIVDLALLKAEVDAPYVFSLGSSEDLNVGDRIYAIGSPIGLESTLTSGIVSSLDRKLFTVGSVIQLDAAINSGNSGGPCIDENGAVQAIAFAGMLQYEGLNFAIPIEYLKAELPGLYHGGKYDHSWLGGFGHTKKELGKEAGLEVQYVMPGGSLSRADVSEDDVIVALNGKPVRTLEDMQRIMFRCAAKSIATLKVVTPAGQEKDVLVYFATRPKNPGYRIYNSDVLANSFIPLFGMKLVHASSTSRHKYSVLRIINGSIADESGFSEHDPVEVMDVEFNTEKTTVYLKAYVKNSKKGYLERVVGMGASLDSPYYF